MPILKKYASSMLQGCFKEGCFKVLSGVFQERMKKANAGTLKKVDIVLLAPDLKLTFLEKNCNILEVKTATK